MHLAIISSFSAVALLSAAICLFALFVTVSQLLFSLKHEDAKAETWTAIAWFVAFVLALGAIVYVAYDNAAQSNILWFLGADVATVMVFMLAMHWRDRFVRWLKVHEREVRYRRSGPHHA